MREIGSVADDLDVGAILEGRFTHMAALWDAHFGEARAIIEFANHFISITCTLNGRKVMTCILKKPQKGEDLTFLTFLNHKWLASVQ